MDKLRSGVRPIVTLMMAFGVLYGFVVGILSAEAFLGIAGVVITFWFRGREDSKTQPPIQT